MRKVITILAFAFCLPLIAFSAERVDLAQASEDVTVTVVESNDNHTILRLDIGGFTREVVDIEGQEYFAILCDKEGVLLNAGEPALPRICRSIIIPDDAEMEIRHGPFGILLDAVMSKHGQQWGDFGGELRHLIEECSEGGTMRVPKIHIVFGEELSPQDRKAT